MTIAAPVNCLVIEPTVKTVSGVTGSPFSRLASPKPLDRMILGELELALAEYDRGDRTEDYVRERVRFLLSLPNPNLVAQLRRTVPVSRS